MRLRLLLFGTILVAPAAVGATPPERDPHHHHHHHGRATTTHHPAHGVVRHPAIAPVPVPVPKPTAPAPPPPPPKPPVGSSTGLPLPRYASLRADEVNLRAGPGTQYPIQWVFKHQGMPVEIRREFDVWRLVAAPDGTVGWVHQATLVGARTFTVPDGAATVTMRRTPDGTAAPVAELQAGAIGRILRCDAGAAWCRVGVHDLQGYVPRSAIWGMLPDEPVGVPTP